MGRFVFKLPDVGEGTAEAEIVAWHVKAGDVVDEDQPLVDVMTDKATVEITSPVAGKVVDTSGEPGDMAPVGSPLVVFEVDGAGNEAAAAKTEPELRAESVAAAEAPSTASRSPSSKGGGAEVVEFAPSAPPSGGRPAAKPPEGGSRHPTPSNVAVRPAFATRVADERPLASPAVRRRARELGIELQYVPGSGPGGRIEHADLDAFVATQGGRRARAARRDRDALCAPRGGRGGQGHRPAPQDRREDAGSEAPHPALHLRRGSRRHRAGSSCASTSTRPSVRTSRA